MDGASAWIFPVRHGVGLSVLGIEDWIPLDLGPSVRVSGTGMRPGPLALQDQNENDTHSHKGWMGSVRASGGAHGTQ